MAGGFGGLVEALTSAGAWLAEAAFPSRCVGCGAEGSLFCGECAAAVLPKPVRRSLKGGVGATAWYPYADPKARALLAAWKFDGMTALETAIGSLVARAAQAVPTLLPDVPVALVPIPLASRRGRERGFNQAARIAAFLLPRLPPGSRVVPALERARPTAQQARLGREARAANVARSFRAIATLPSGMPVLLVDDVVTSGETLAAAAAALREAGAGNVRAVALAYGRID